MSDNFSNSDLALLIILIGVAFLFGAVLFVGAVKLSLIVLGLSA